jgi:predicted deacylase
MPSGIVRQWLPVTAELSLPLLTAHGAAPGPVLAVTAGVHGDEYEGVRTIFSLFETLDTAALRGTVLAVPVVNPPAHRACSRTSPLDGQNLARVFPGRPDGTVSERIADVLAREVIAKADFYIDLHSGGVRYAMPSMAGYASFDERGRKAAEAFGAPVIWGHPVIEPGRTISIALERGIPFLYCEAWGAGRIAPADLEMMQRGLDNLLRHLGMLPGEPRIPHPPRRLKGVGNTDKGLEAGADGFLLLDVALMDRVGAGQQLGRLVDLQGNELERYAAPCAGTVALTHEMPMVAKGDTLFLLADEE